MPVRKFEGCLCIVRLEFSPSEIPDLLSRHAKHYPGARLLEAAGRELAQQNFEPSASVDFVQRVHKWGGGQRQMSRVRDKNPPAAVAVALSEAAGLAQRGDVSAGVECIRRLRQVGQSFASKQLRFLEPLRAVILDSVIRTGLGYAETSEGYAEFLGDCQIMLAEVQQSRAIEPSLAEALRVCDIEAAIFAKLQGY